MDDPPGRQEWTHGDLLGPDHRIEKLELACNRIEYAMERALRMHIDKTRAFCQLAVVTLPLQECLSAPAFPGLALNGKTSLVINGRFLGRAMTGVERVAFEHIRTLGDMVRNGTLEARLTIACPRNVDAATVEACFPSEQGYAYSFGRLTGHLWEQFELPRLARGAMLLNFCNTAPLAKRDQFVLIHDAQIFSDPSSYSIAFRTFYHFLLPRLGRRSRSVATVSDFSRREMERFQVASAGAIHCIPNGVDHIDRVVADHDFLARQRLRPGQYLLALGSLAPHKNLRMLINARAATPGGLKLIVAGGGNARVFADAGLAESEDVQMLGRVDDAQLKALYNGAKAFFFPSKTEGFGLPPLEAMRCGCPVVATNGGAVPEILGDAAILLDPRDQRQWSAAMSQVEEDDGLCDRLKMAGKARSAEFTWCRAARQVVAALASDR